MELLSKNGLIDFLSKVIPNSKLVQMHREQEQKSEHRQLSIVRYSEMSQNLRRTIDNNHFVKHLRYEKGNGSE